MTYQSFPPILSTLPTVGTTLTDADATITIAGGAQYFIPPATITANRVITAGTSGSPITGETLTIVRRGTEAFTVTIKDDAATSLFVIPASTKFAVVVRWSGTHYVIHEAVRIQ